MVKLVLFGLLFSLFVTPAYASTVIVKSNVKLSGAKHVYLYNLVESKNISAVLKKQLMRVKLSDAPRKGERRIFTGRAISQAVRKKISNKSIKFRIPKHVIVENPVYTITKEAVKKKIIDNWKRMCRECEFKFTSFNLPQLSQNLKSNQWEIINNGQVPMGSFSELLKIKNHNDVINYWVTGQVKISKKVPILKRTLFIGQNVQPEDIEFETRDVTYLRHKTVPVKAQIFGRKLRSGLRSNEIVWLDNLARDKALRRGDMVIVTQDNENWSMGMKAVAQQDGFVGDVIKLINPNTNKVISGRVVGRNKVSLL